MGNVPDKCDNPTGTVRQDLYIKGTCKHAVYEDERFEDVVSENFHCVICTNVLKDPVTVCAVITNIYFAELVSPNTWRGLRCALRVWNR
jgi:hypothetical protein